MFAATALFLLGTDSLIEAPLSHRIFGLAEHLGRFLDCVMVLESWRCLFQHLQNLVEQDRPVGMVAIYGLAQSEYVWPSESHCYPAKLVDRILHGLKLVQVPVARAGRMSFQRSGD